MRRKSMRVGGGGRFAKLTHDLERKAGVKDPAAVAAAIGRRKYGKAGFQRMATRGHRRMLRRHGR